jgi:hypothetical protein
MTVEGKEDLEKIYDVYSLTEVENKPKINPINALLIKKLKNEDTASGKFPNFYLHIPFGPY